MQQRIHKLRRAIRLAGGVDIVLAHGAPLGVGDAEDRAHQGFASFLKLMEVWRPKYFLHGHVHLNYGVNIQRVIPYGDTQVINCCGTYVLETMEPAEKVDFSIWKKILCKLFAKNLMYWDWQ